MIGGIVGFLGWMFAWVFSWLFFFVVGVGVGFQLRSLADPASQAVGITEQIISSLRGWLKRKEPTTQKE